MKQEIKETRNKKQKPNFNNLEKFLNLCMANGLLDFYSTTTHGENYDTYSYKISKKYLKKETVNNVIFTKLIHFKSIGIWSENYLIIVIGDGFFSKNPNDIDNHLINSVKKIFSNFLTDEKLIELSNQDWY